MQGARAQGSGKQAFDPFGIADLGGPMQPGEPEQEEGLPPVTTKFDAFEDDFDEDATTPLSGSGSAKAPHKLVKVI